MGWCHESGMHEGFIVGVEPEPRGYRWREVGSQLVEPPATRPVSYVQVACECGWRSARILAPPGTEWSPNIVMLRESEQGFEEACWQIWKDAHEQMLAAHVVEGQSRQALYLRCRECSHDAHRYACWQQGCACKGGTQAKAEARALAESKAARRA